MEFVQEDITTLHDLGAVNCDCPLADTAVVVPVGENDLASPSVKRTLDLVCREPVGSLIVPIRGPRQAVSELGRSLDPAATVLWCDSPQIRTLLEEMGVDPTGTKGLDVWLALAVATAENEHVIVHDADATSYTPEHLYRLRWPLTRGVSFTKGYYARMEDDQLFGRLLRLLWAPLMAALSESDADPLIDYLSAFRYALAGEFSGNSSTLRQFQIPHGWGLEVGILAEAFKHVGSTGTAQVDLGWHRHDHRPVAGPNGLSDMAAAVVGILLEVLRDNDIAVDYDQLEQQYRRQANQYQRQYAMDASFNGLRYDGDAEKAQIEQYAAAIQGATAPSLLPALSSTDLTADTIRNRARLTTTTIDN